MHRACLCYSIEIGVQVERIFDPVQITNFSTLISYFRCSGYFCNLIIVLSSDTLGNLNVLSELPMKKLEKVEKVCVFVKFGSEIFKILKNEMCFEEPT